MRFGGSTMNAGYARQDRAGCEPDALQANAPEVLPADDGALLRGGKLGDIGFDDDPPREAGAVEFGEDTGQVDEATAKFDEDAGIGELAIVPAGGHATLEHPLVDVLDVDGADGGPVILHQLDGIVPGPGEMAEIRSQEDDIAIDEREEAIQFGAGLDERSDMVVEA